MRTLLLSLFLIGISCAGQKGLPADNAKDSHQEVQMLEHLLSDSHSGVEQETFMVVRDSKALRNFFLQINKTRKPGLSVPVVDFTKEIVVIYCGGIGPGYRSVKIELLKESQDTIILGLKEGTPSQKGGILETTPFCMYKLPFTQKEISLQSK